MAAPIIQQFAVTASYAGSTNVPIRIGAQNFWITAIGLTWNPYQYSTGSSSAPTQENMWRAITALQLNGGGRPYVTLNNDARSLYWAMRTRMRGRFRAQDIRKVDSTSNLKLKVELPLIFGVNPVLANGAPNWFDTSAAVAPDTDLTLNLNFGAAGSTSTNSVNGTNYAVSTSSQIMITLFGVTLGPNDPKPGYYPSWNTSQWAPTQTYAGKGGIVQISPGFWYRASTLLFLNGSTSAPPADERTNGMNSNAFSEFGLKTADGRFPIDMKVWDFVQASQAGFQAADDNTAGSDAGGLSVTAALAASSLISPWNPGVGRVDYTQIADTGPASPASPLYGIDMRGKSPGAVSFALTVDAATNSYLNQFHECYLPY